MTQVHQGATLLANGSCRFAVWAPQHNSIALHVIGDPTQPYQMRPTERGYHEVEVAGVCAGTRYRYILSDGREYPDPASRFQPEGVHGPSAVTNDDFLWTDRDWSGAALADYVIYELHVGTFTREGTFDAAATRLASLKEMGFTAIELMPVAQFPGTRNWGYDGTYPYAVHDSYGGPEGLKRFVDCCHSHGMAAVLDVVYNHFGPEGNYAGEFGPYFTSRYQTPWGRAINFDGPHSDEVRHFFIDNALYWLRDFHFDALRLDALHAILDTSAYPFLAQLVDSVAEESSRQRRPLYLIGESDLNDPRLIQERRLGGIGLHAQWNDDFHHSLHTLLTGEETGYYADFGSIEHLARAFAEGFVYSGQYSEYRQRSHGAPSTHVGTDHFVVFAQNHDQIGNRMQGDRLTTMVSEDAVRLAATCVLLGPSIPLVFMGEEYGETAPFPYFVSHSDKALIEAVRRGRRDEFSSFQWQGEVPDPQDEMTFRKAILHWDRADRPPHGNISRFNAELLSLRHELPALRHGRATVIQCDATGNTMALQYSYAGTQLVLAMNMGMAHGVVELSLPPGRWTKRIDSSDTLWGGPGNDVPPYTDSTGPITLRMTSQSALLLQMK